jgi:hypothetical protein
MVSHARLGISQDSDIRYCVELLKLGSCRNLASYLLGEKALDIAVGCALPPQQR